MNYFDEVIKEYLSTEEPEEEVNTYTVNIQLQAKGLDTDHIENLLNHNGLKVISISGNEIKNTVKESSYPSNIGKKVIVSEDIVVANNILMKTCHSLYKISKVVLPKDSIGIIADVKDGKYVVDFSASLPIDPRYIVEGYDSTKLTYNLDLYSLDSSQVEFI